jgi:hypothetical protein
MLYCEYSYSASLEKVPEMPISSWGSYRMPKLIALDYTKEYVPPGAGPLEAHDRVGCFFFGAGLTTFLSVMRLRFAAWPFHPIGYLFCYTWGVRNIWFSIFIGWLAKVLIMHFGGALMFTRSRNVFLGMILGESGAVAFWLAINLVLVKLGMDYSAIEALPNH